MKEQIAASEQKLKAMKQENRKRRKMIEAYQEMMNAGATGLHPVSNFITTHCHLFTSFSFSSSPPLLLFLLLFLLLLLLLLFLLLFLLLLLLLLLLLFLFSYFSSVLCVRGSLLVLSIYMVTFSVDIQSIPHYIQSLLQSEWCLFVHVCGCYICLPVCLSIV